MRSRRGAGMRGRSIRTLGIGLARATRAGTISRRGRAGQANQQYHPAGIQTFGRDGTLRPKFIVGHPYYGAGPTGPTDDRWEL